MLAELLVTARSRGAAPPEFRRHVAPAVRYWAAGMRAHRAWAPHLAHARGLLDTSIDDVRRRDTVVVLGSGPLFDIPLESLARTFRRVLLVDRAHLSATLPRLARYRNVERHWRDLGPGTGDPLGFLRQVDGLDWVISSCVLAEIAMAAPAEARRAAIDSHLDALAGLDCPATLIAELDFRVFNRHGVMLDSADLMQGRPVPRSGLRWKWEVAPFGSEHRSTRRVSYVAAWADWREA